MGLDDMLGAGDQQALAAAREKLARSVKSGANWFYWIAGLSLVNSVVHLTGGGLNFIVGLGITQVVDAIAAGVAQGTTGPLVGAARAFAIVLDVVAAGVFALLGRQANKQRSWAFGVGMVLYTLDGLIFVVAQDWLSLAFHAFALYGIWSGYSSLKKLASVEIAHGLRPTGPGAG